MKEIKFVLNGWSDYLYWQGQDKKIVKKINKLIQDLSRSEKSGLGKDEALKGDFQGWWSKRIDQKNRLIYRLREGVIEIAQCRGHYSDK